MGRKTELNVIEVAKIIQKTPQYVRIGLQQQRLPFGDAVQNENGRWSYCIYQNKFYEYVGIKKGE